MGMDGSKEQTRYTDLQDSRSGPWSALFGTLGGLAIVGGGALAFGSQISPGMGWIARSLGRIGLDSGVAIGCGVISIGVSIVFRQLHRMNAKLAAAEESVERTEFLSLAMRQLSETMNVIHSEICELKDHQIAMMQADQDGNVAESVGMQVDATYRLASSIDQLGANFETRLGQQTELVMDSLRQFSESISSKQDELSSLIEEAAQDADERWPEYDPGTLNSEPRLKGRNGFGEYEDDEELQVEVELEGWEEITESKVDVSSYDWDSVKIPEQHRKTDLGMLDDISDVESIPAPLPKQESSKAGNDGLGLLDELSEDGRRVEQEEPPSLVRGNSIPLKKAQEPSGLSDDDLEEAWDVFNETDQE